MVISKEETPSDDPLILRQQHLRHRTEAKLQRVDSSTITDNIFQPRTTEFKPNQGKGKGGGTIGTKTKSAKKCKARKASKQGNKSTNVGKGSSRRNLKRGKVGKTYHRESCPPDEEEEEPPQPTTPSPTFLQTAPPTAVPTTSSPPSSLQPTADPTTFHPTISFAPSAFDCSSPNGRAVDVEHIVTSISGDVVSGSPQDFAYQWLKYVDDSDNCLGTMGQRYGLAVFYYSTNGPSWNESDGWLSPNDYCQWTSIRCDTDGNVLSLRLNDNGLGGSLPTEIAALTSLSQLRVFNNAIAGQVPTQLYTLPNIELLDLESNLLSGPVLLADMVHAAGTLKRFRCSDNDFVGTVDGNLLSSMSFLEEFWFATNLITGTLPTELVLLTNLNSLIAYENALTGTIPQDLSSLSYLEYLDLSSNAILGTIPSSLGGLTDMESLFLSHMGLTGTIPSTLGNLIHLDHLDLQENTLTGSIPTEFENLVNVTAIDLSNNTLSGPLPSFGDYTKLDFLDLSENALSGQIPHDLFHDESVLRVIYLSNNTFSGTIPPSFVNITILEDIWLDGNELTGTIPSVTSDKLPKIEEILFDDNQLTGPVPDGYCILRATLFDENLEEQFRALHADCLPPEGSDVPNNSCDCCTACTSGK